VSELLPLSIGVGLVVALVFGERFGLSAGGLVVPGYLALFLDRPAVVALTLAAGLLTYGVVELAARAAFVFGRRRVVATLLVGYAVAVLVRALEPGAAGGALGAALGGAEQDAVVGYVIPGLVGLSFGRHGVVETTSGLVVASAVVRLVLVLVVGAELGHT
jgi:poly-gamma-glutamate biosynthesis protein PgsC/CapC